LPYNGSVSAKQLAWLHEQLAEATTNKENVIVACHIPVCPGSTTNETLLWNYDEVLTTLHSYSCVKAFLAGHDHAGGYKVDAKNIHHKTFEAALEAPGDLMAFGVINVFSDHMELKGEGTVASATWMF